MKLITIIAVVLLAASVLDMNNWRWALEIRQLVSCEFHTGMDVTIAKQVCEKLQKAGLVEFSYCDEQVFSMTIRAPFSLFALLDGGESCWDLSAEVNKDEGKLQTPLR